MDEHGFPNKPTSYLLYNCEYQPDVICDCQCDNRLTTHGDRKLHKYVICRNKGQHPDQQVLTGVMEKGRIPLMVFGHFVARHARHVASQSQVAAQFDRTVRPPETVRVDKVSPATAVAAHNGQIVQTGKRPRSAGIVDRINRIHGRSYTEAIGTMYTDNTGTLVPYEHKDYRYDVEKGFIRHAMLVTSAVTQDEAHAAS